MIGSTFTNGVIFRGALGTIFDRWIATAPRVNVPWRHTHTAAYMAGSALPGTRLKTWHRAQFDDVFLKITRWKCRRIRLCANRDKQHVAYNYSPNLGRQAANVSGLGSSDRGQRSRHRAETGTTFSAIT